MRPKIPISIRFWEKINKTDTCWLWTGGRLVTGYGQFLVKTGTTPAYAHHVAYVLTRRTAVPKGMYLVQTCGDRLCCNPDHLEVTDKKPERKPRATRARVDLTIEDIETIRRCARTKEFTTRELARKYGVMERRIISLIAVIKGKVGTQWRN